MLNIYLCQMLKKFIRKNKKFNLKKSEKILCAKYRPGHFEGVLNVMDRLLALIDLSIYLWVKRFPTIFSY